MLTYQKNTVRTSVRKLVEFLLRTGDISTGSSLTADVEAMQEGSRLHRKIQRAQKASYQSEVPLKMCWPQEEYMLVLEGRADGIDTVEENGEKITLIDEIKGVYQDVNQKEEADPLHLAQAKCYACMYGKEKGITKVLVQITYCNIETEEVKKIKEHFSMNELEEWFQGLIDQYKMWADNYVEMRKKRKESIAGLKFPFRYRPGQKKLAAMVYQSIRTGEHVFLQAPTGVGKTISMLYPALKAVNEEYGERIFYLTAKTITRTVAEQTITLLRKQGLRLRTVTLTAKEKICPNEQTDCNPETCARACGHYDRINAATYALLNEQENVRREHILDYSERYQVCPYALSFEAAQWADCLICDYNYIFDPHMKQTGLFADKKGSLLLIDEAHNLLDRAREMYSASLCKKDFLKMKKIFQHRHRGIAKKLQRCNAELLKMKKEGENLSLTVDRLYYPLFWLLTPLGDYLKEHPEMKEREEVVNFYFQIRHFFMMLETMEQGYEVYGEAEKNHFMVRLYCVDPSSRLKEYLDQCRLGIFFSATLLPVQYYKQLLGGNQAMDAFSISSPFDPERKLLAIAQDVTSRYKQRGPLLYEKIVRYLEKTLSVKSGNYIIFFPSYEMMEQVYALANQSNLAVVSEMICQETGMEERSREEFLEAFSAERKNSLLGFCVLGSIFSEGIDLTGNRLIGVFIVGTGIPQICKEREIMKTYFDRQGKKGYDYAYRYPGMNKVLQAAGRVIRTAEDVGAIVLLDDRFLRRENQILLPEDWDSYYEVNLYNYQRVLEQFWEKYTDEI